MTETPDRPAAGAVPVMPVGGHELGATATGSHHEPHSVLGAHEYEGGVTVRTLKPFAHEVSVILPEGGAVAMEHEHDGIWVAALDRPSLPSYRIRVTWSAQAQPVELEEPYRFLPTVGEFDLHLIGEGRHEELWRALGAHVRTVDGVEGTSFAVWAPNARAVQVVGSFNGWDGRLHSLRSLGSSGVWELFAPTVGDGDVYKYRILGADGVWRDKADPMARAAEVPPATGSVVTSSDFEWSDEHWLAERAAQDALTSRMSIYEVHLASWRPGLTYRELATELTEYVTEMGFTHVEFMPVAEHPFGGSWGYQVTGYYAPTSRLGTPDELRHLIDALHNAGIGVILDWVPAHFPKDEWALGRFDGTPLYEHADPRRGEHPDWGTYVFDTGRNEVRNFLVANACYWLEEFHVDGLRVDAVASMLYLDYSRQPGQWRANVRGGRENLEAIEFLQETTATAYRRYPGIIMMAEESTAWPGVTAPTSVGGLGFGLKWNMGWMNDTLRYLAEAPINRRYHHGGLTFSLVYAFSEQFILPLSHDEVVHGKGSLLQKMPGDRWQQLAGLRALFAYQWTHPGKKLLFMGGEFGQEHEWAESQSLQWEISEEAGHAGVRQLVRDLNRVYTQHAALWADDFTHAGFTWLVAGDGDHNVIAYLREGESSQVAVAVNFAGSAHENYRLPLPRTGQWREILNTDAPAYGGSGVGNLGMVTAKEGPHDGFPASALVQLPPLGTVMFVHAEEDA